MLSCSSSSSVAKSVAVTSTTQLTCSAYDKTCFILSFFYFTSIFLRYLYVKQSLCVCVLSVRLRCMCSVSAGFSGLDCLLSAGQRICYGAGVVSVCFSVGNLLLYDPGCRILLYRVSFSFAISLLS